MDDSNTHLFELATIVFGLTEIIKDFIPRKYRRKMTPLLALALGGLGNVYLMGYSPRNLVYGLALGLAASGVYKAARKAMTQTINVPHHHHASRSTALPSEEPLPSNPAPLITEPLSNEPRSVRPAVQAANPNAASVLPQSLEL